jgi:hypothetical protein
MQGPPGERGPRGPEGPTGKFPVVKAWTDRVHYAGDIVVAGGSLWQASNDTGQPPGSADWLCLAARGLDARSLTIRGTYDSGAVYQALDVTILNGGSFVARCDAPGECPGPNWQCSPSKASPASAVRAASLDRKGRRVPQATRLHQSKAGRSIASATPQRRS